MPVDTPAERIGMLADFGFLIDYRQGGLNEPGVPVQAIWDISQATVGEPPLFDGISSAQPTLLVLTSDVPEAYPGDGVDLEGVEGFDPNGYNTRYVIRDVQPMSSDNIYTRLIISKQGDGRAGGIPGSPVIPT